MKKTIHKKENNCTPYNNANNLHELTLELKKIEANKKQDELKKIITSDLFDFYVTNGDQLVIFIKMLCYENIEVLIKTFTPSTLIEKTLILTL